ncbi:MAG: 5'-nucleotidase C-terminal domain-containing protein, partial [Pseudomonadota bacterium]
VARGVDPRQGTLHGVPTVMPGYAAEALGVIDLDLAWSQHGWQVTRHASGLRHHPPTIAPHPELAELTAPAITATRAALDVGVGRTPTGFHNYFEMLGTGTSTALIGAAMCAVITKRAAGTPLSDLPVIASVSPMALGGRGGTSNYVDVPQGVITERHLSMMCPYPNAVWAAVLTGAQVRAWAERAAVFFSPIPTGLSALVNPNAPSFNFDALYGLNTVVDPFAPVAYAVDGRPIAETATRIIAQSYQGKPIDASDRFLVAMTSYRGAGGGAFPGVGCETIRTEVEVKDALRQLIRNGGPNEASPEPAWHFSTGHKAPVLIETSPRATQHLDEIAKFNPIVAGKNSAGFLQLEVSI